VILIFDRALTAFRTSAGELRAPSHQLLETSVHSYNPHFQAEMDVIIAHSFAVEIRGEINEEQRATYMNEWWQKAYELLLKQGIHRSWLRSAIDSLRKAGMLELRKGAHDMLHRLNELNVPCLIFSAGIDEPIRMTLEDEGLLLPNIHLIANEMKFNADGKLIGFSEDTITSSNKNYTHVRNGTGGASFTAQAGKRKNVILLGDNIGDGGMVTGLEHVDTVIRIGYLHDNVEARLEKFKQTFDVLLLNDADLTLLDDIVTKVANQRETANGVSSSGGLNQIQNGMTVTSTSTSISSSVNPSHDPSSSSQQLSS